MPDHRRDVEQLARIVLDPSARSVEQVDAEQLDRLVDTALDHRVAGSLSIAWRDAGRALPDRLLAATQLAAVDHLRTRQAVDQVAQVLGAAGVRWAIVKGPVMARRWPHGPAERTYDDLDLLVAPQQLRAAAEALTNAGFRHRNSNWRGFRQLGVGEIPLDDGSVVIDLHWHLVGLGAQRSQVDLPTLDLLERGVEVDLGGTTVRTLCDVDTLVHLCCHDALAGAQSLMHLRDVHLVASELPDRIVRDRLIETRTARLAAVVLDRVERTFGQLGAAPMSSSVTGDPGWIALNRVIDRLWAATPAAGWTPYPGALAGAGRSTARATFRAAAHDLAESVRAHLGRPTLVSPGGPLDWTVQAGGDVERERFFDEVAAGSYGW
jgi:hypothetical protein